MLRTTLAGLANRATAIVAWLGTVWAASACTGLMAGPDSSAQNPVPVSRDSAYTRARRAVTAESFTLDVVDSTGGRLIGTRFPSSNAHLGSAGACRITLALAIKGDATQSEVGTTSRWLAPVAMSDKAPQVCERERVEVLERIAQTVAPPPQ
jgi:hypothetical protein